MNVTTLKRNIKLLAEVLASHIYGFHGKGLEVFTGSLAVHDDFVNAWAMSLSQHARMLPFLSTAPKNSPESRLMEGLEKAMEAYTTSLRKDPFTAPSPVHFYRVSNVKMSAFRVKPVAFDVVLSLLLVVYFAALFFGLQGFGPGCEKLRSLFAKKAKRN